MSVVVGDGEEEYVPAPIASKKSTASSAKSKKSNFSAKPSGSISSYFNAALSGSGSGEDDAASALQKRSQFRRKRLRKRLSEGSGVAVVYEYATVRLNLIRPSIRLYNASVYRLLIALQGPF